MSDRYFLLYAPTGYSWPVNDPVAWLHDHADNPFLERARERLVTLAPDDGDRILRLVTRRCRLVLIDLASPASVVVQHWGQPAPDIRGFLKDRRLARPQVRVALVNRKTEGIAIVPGSDFLYGEAAAGAFPWQRFETKWRHRLDKEADDWKVAPHTENTLCWEQASGEKATPWAVLKGIWRRDQAPPCPNCDTPLAVLRFLWVLPIMFSGIRKITRGCFHCRQQFTEALDTDFWGWLVKTLDPDLLPTHQWGTRKYDLRSRRPSPPERG